MTSNGGNLAKHKSEMGFGRNGKCSAAAGGNSFEDRDMEREFRDDEEEFIVENDEELEGNLVESGASRMVRNSRFRGGGGATSTTTTGNQKLGVTFQADCEAPAAEVGGGNPRYRKTWI